MDAGQRLQVCLHCGLRFATAKPLEHTTGAMRTPLGELYRRPMLVLAVKTETMPPAAA